VPTRYFEGLRFQAVAPFPFCDHFVTGSSKNRIFQPTGCFGIPILTLGGHIH